MGLPSGKWSGLKPPPGDEGIIQIGEDRTKPRELLLRGNDSLTYQFYLNCGFALLINGEPFVSFTSEEGESMLLDIPKVYDYPGGDTGTFFSNVDSKAVKLYSTELNLNHDCVRAWISEKFEIVRGFAMSNELWAVVVDSCKENNFETAVWARGMFAIGTSCLNELSEEDEGNQVDDYEKRLVFALLEDYIYRLIQAAKVEISDNFRYQVYHGPLRSYKGRKVSSFSDMSSVHSDSWDNEDIPLITNRDLINEVNAWLGEKLGMKTPYKLEVRKFFDSDESKNRFEEDLENIYKSGGPQFIHDKRWGLLASSGGFFEIAFKDERAGVFLGAKDVGVGISQILPILISGIKNKNNRIFIEQPELHLHPACQGELADFFIDSSLGARSNQFIIETHSEHLLLRLMRRIREQELGKAHEGAPVITADDVAILYVKPTEDGGRVREIKLNALGELVNDWPGGFFEEGIREMLL